MRRRGVEMSLNVIILIVLGLVVLSIIIYLVVNYSRQGGADLRSCAGKGGSCQSFCDSGEQRSTFFTSDCRQGEVCCMRSALTQEG